MISKSIYTKFKNIYWSLFIVITAISLFGILFIYAASYHSEGWTNAFVIRQTIWLIIGIFFLFAITFIGYRPLLNLSYIIYLCSIFLLCAVFVIGKETYGAQRWIPIGGFALQPSEFTKLSVILVLSHYLGCRKQNLLQKKRFIISFLLTFIPLILIVKQPDLGTALIFLPILYCMLFVWGAKIKYILISFILGIVSLPVIWHMLKGYQKTRLLTFININADPLGSGYTAIQSKIAVGSGELWGKGLLCGTQNRLNFVPEHHTDFIFCVIGEEGGFLASISLILLFFIIIKLAIDVIQKTTDPEAQLLAAGITAMLTIQIFVNIGMSIGICPITGLPLPFISYGGSSLITYFIAFGFLISIYKERSIF